MALYKSKSTSVICYQCSCSNVNNHVISYSLQDLVRIFDTVWYIRYNIYANMNRLYVYYKVSKYGIGWFGQQLLLIIYVNNIFLLDKQNWLLIWKWLLVCFFFYVTNFKSDRIRINVSNFSVCCQKNIKMHLYF